MYCFHTCIAIIFILTPSGTEPTAEEEDQSVDEAVVEEMTAQETQQNTKTGEMHHSLII